MEYTSALRILDGVHYKPKGRIQYKPIGGVHLRL